MSQIFRRKIKNSQAGIIHLMGLFVAVAAIGLVSFLLIASSAPFKNKLFNALFPKPFSHAASNPNDWPQLQYDSQRSGHTTNFVPPNYVVQWAWMDSSHVVQNFVSAPNKSITDGFGSFKLANQLPSTIQPIVAEGKVYFGTQSNTFYALNALTGATQWSFTASGPIISTAAYSCCNGSGGGMVVFGSNDGKIYGLNTIDGSLAWSYQTGAGILASPVLSNGVIFIGSGDGSFYALNAITGSLNWKYDSRDPSSATSGYNKAPIIAPAAVSPDGTTVFFGAENMYFYALNTSDGKEKWTPRKVIGQSFRNAWPVISGNLVIVRPMSSLISGNDNTMEAVLDSVPSPYTWSAEKAAIQNYVNTTPQQKSIYVFDATTGNEPFQVYAGRTASFGMAPIPAVLDNQNRPIFWWRTKQATLLAGGPCWGTKYCPDVAAMDQTTGDKVSIPNSNTSKFGAEIDNLLDLTVGGDYLYLDSSFRGVNVVSLKDGSVTRVSRALAFDDGSDNRAWGYQILYFGNDSTPTVDNRSFATLQGGGPLGPGVAIANINGTSMMFVNEPEAGAVVAIRSTTSAPPPQPTATPTPSVSIVPTPAPTSVSTLAITPTPAISPTPTPIATPTPTSSPTDKALNKPTVASSTAIGSASLYAVDGNPATVWTSALGGAQWIYVDLGATTTVTSVTTTWGTAVATNFDIETSDDANTWNPGWSAANGNGTFTINRTGRYVRLNIKAGSDLTKYDLATFSIQ